MKFLARRTVAVLGGAAILSVGFGCTTEATALASNVPAAPPAPPTSSKPAPPPPLVVPRAPCGYYTCRGNGLSGAGGGGGAGGG